MIYARISRDREGAGLGVDRQEKDCRDLAERLGWTVAAVRTDNDLSAYSGKPRPGYRALLDDLKTGRGDAVIAWHTDRLHRSPAELEDYIAVCDPGGAPTHTVKAGPLDLSTPSGRAVARTLGAWARFEIEHAIERQKNAKLQAARAGKWRGGPRPFGYEADGCTVREDEAVELRAAVASFLAGESLGSIARGWNERGVPTSTGGTWSQPAVRDVLRRPRNAGKIEAGAGEPIADARWPALIDEATWRALRAILRDPSRNKGGGRERRWLGSGLYLCGLCGDGTTMRSATSMARGGRRICYRCRNGGHLVRVAEPLDEYVSEVAIERLSRPDAVSLLARDAAVDTSALHDEGNTTRARLDELTALYTDGAIDGRQLADGTRRLRDKLDALDEQLAAATSCSALAGIVGADDVRAVWYGNPDDPDDEGLPVGRRRAIVDSLMTVTLLRAPRGRRPGGGYFDPEFVHIEPKDRSR